GIFQLLAFIPGTSRSAATIIGGLFSSLNRKAATEFSFFLGVPILLSAAIYEFYKGDVFGGEIGSTELFLGLLSSFIFAVIAIKGFIFLLKRFSLRPFAYYRILVGVFSLYWFV